ncbi:GMC family oxidoreductase [Streptomyces sp. H27-H1]|uniref:GMC family oxidoreductase n=1 Tax=unclassified Streptomyces TaxID=2593676 RepID=UPI00226EB95A|nr:MULTISPECIES: GMC family oxidoreductase [unclassified Streptomyces]MCY0929453.1 GMC family oxidoreductase [Streptomyces sp. H27-H1]MCY0938331.1 GMC family oxidoreductase [Streptomyces sp. H34-S4]
MVTSYDVVIVGAGVAGALCACQIKTAKPQANILLIDTGNNALDDSQRTTFVDAYQVSTAKNVPSPYAALPNNKLGYAPSADGTGDPVAMNRYYVESGPDLLKSGFQRMVGGSTWAWRGNSPRFMPRDFQLKTNYGVGVDWPFSYADLEPHYARAEAELGVSGNRSEWDPALTPRSTDFPMPGIAASYGDELVRTALASIAPIDGTPVTVLTTPQARNSQPYQGRQACQGNSSCIPVCPSGAKYDASVHVRRARDQLGVEVRTGCTVTRLITNPGTAAPTVVFRDWTTPDRAEQQVTGTHVVLALNAIETPKLWLLSALDNRSDQVGRNLMDHLAEEVVGLFGQPVFPFRGPQSTLSIETFRDGNFRRNTGAFRMTIGNDGWGRTETPAAALDKLMWDPAAKKIKLIGQELQDRLAERVTRMLRFGYSTEQLPDPANRVTLSDERDGLDTPRPKITYKVDDYSKRALAYGHSVARRIWQHLENTAGATEIDPVQPLLKFNGAGHLMGTMRMGTDRTTSVVNADGLSHAHPNLWVVGSSVFPTGSTANPTLTLAALTLRTADKLAATL